MAGVKKSFVENYLRHLIHLLFSKFLLLLLLFVVNNMEEFEINSDINTVQTRGGQLDQFREPHFRRQQSARAMKLADMNYIWKTCDNN
jgi:hypothetical protein